MLLSGLLLSLAGFGEEGSIEEKREAVTNLAIFSTSLLYIIAPISLYFIFVYFAWGVFENSPPAKMLDFVFSYFAWGVLESSPA